ncbi:response regulator [Halobacterium litoreum]|uniref:Response regulator n=1 Tax=Halobacterium litoreum TaxID=2039234 RepID=A0ABD5NIK4_9EURY|nr:response regulator [Halobacterium litoreum]UHH12245.1 response regulator [Halobacterium litoreum]
MQHHAPTDVTVLHVDDEPGFTELVAEFLEREAESLSVRTATAAEDALDALDAECVDCIVSDHDMPGMTGLELLEAVREDHPDFPFILFTGKGSEEIASRAISAGVTDYLQKQGGTEQYAILANRVLNTVRIARFEQAVERTEVRYHNLVDTAPIPIVLFDQSRRLVYANEAAIDFLEADSVDQLRDYEMPDLLHPEDRDAALDRFADLMGNDRAASGREFRVRAVDGTVKPASVATAPGHYRGRKVAQAIVYE